jgi:hypothetical protein
MSQQAQTTQQSTCLTTANGDCAQHYKNSGDNFGVLALLVVGVILYFIKRRKK